MNAMKMYLIMIWNKYFTKTAIQKKKESDDESEEYEESDYSINFINYSESYDKNENKNSTRVENSLNLVKENFKINSEKVEKSEIWMVVWFWCWRTNN